VELVHGRLEAGAGVKKGLHAAGLGDDDEDLEAAEELRRIAELLPEPAGPIQRVDGG
jgi:hypothetical protein